MFISQQLTVLIYDILAVVLGVVVTNVFLVVENARNNYHSQKLGDISKLELMLKLPGLITSRQVSRSSLFALILLLAANTATSFVTTILNSKTNYVSKYINGTQSVYSVSLQEFNAKFNLGNQCADGDTSVNCLYSNIGSAFGINLLNLTNDIGTVGTQFEGINGLYTFSDNASIIGGGPNTGISTSAGDLLLPGFSGTSKFVYTGVYGEMSNSSDSTYEFVRSGPAGFFPEFNIASTMYVSPSTEIGNPFSNIAASCLFQLSFYTAQPTDSTYQNMTTQTLEYFYGNASDVTMVMATAYSFGGPVNNLEKALTYTDDVLSFSGMESDMSSAAMSAFVNATLEWSNTTGYVLAMHTDTTKYNSACYEIIYIANMTDGELGMIHAKNCLTVLATNTSGSTTIPSNYQLAPVNNVRFGSTGYDLVQENCKYGAGVGPQVYDYKDLRTQNVLLRMASNGNITIPIVTGKFVVGNDNGLPTVIGMLVAAFVAAGIWLVNKRTAALFSTPLLDMVLNTTTNDVKGVMTLKTQGIVQICVNGDRLVAEKADEYEKLTSQQLQNKV